MGDIKVGTASWTDKTLLASGWYPQTADTPEKRLAHYARQFPLVEVDATYYSPPAEQTARLWVDRTPPAFTFNIKAFSLLTGHPTKVSAIYKDLRPETDKKNVYPGDLSPQAMEDVWTRFLSALDPLAEAGKLGVLLFQFPPWFTIRRSNKQYLLEVAKRCSPLRVAMEFRHASWFEGDNRAETLEFLRKHDLPFVCVDMPQGYRSSIPPVLEPTADLAVVRFHGHSEKWTSKDIYEKFGYLYADRELKDWAPKLRSLADDTGETHVLMNNCYSDYAQRNASRLLDFLNDEA
ncbi:MAG TPA: DUF72 domain-containing protein [Micromonosporaceae bacterium]|nr:DUF72 domain-containing protein [Micromonosporaceae bacterium]